MPTTPSPNESVPGNPEGGPGHEVHIIHIIIAPIEEPTLPATPDWGLPAGPLPLAIQPRIQEVEDWNCPHCRQPVDEKSVYCNIESGKMFHQPCRGEFTHDATNQPMIDHFRQTWGIGEGLYVQNDKGLTRTDKPPVMVNQLLIMEALAKSVEERIHRRTRRMSETQGRKPAPVIKRDGDNDPRKTSRGRSNFRGTEKASQDAKKRRHPEQFNEAVEFLRKVYNKPIDLVIEQAGALADPITVLEVLEKAHGTKLDGQWLNTAKRAIVTVLEGRQFRKGPYVAAAENPESIKSVEASIKEEVARVKKFLPDAWIERIRDDRGRLLKYHIVGHKGQAYESAMNQGLIQHIGKDN